MVENKSILENFILPLEHVLFIMINIWLLTVLISKLDGFNIIYGIVSTIKEAIASYIDETVDEDKYKQSSYTCIQIMILYSADCPNVENNI